MKKVDRETATQKRTKSIVSALLGIILLSAFLYTRHFLEPKERHIHAGFRVYVDGKLQDFSGPEYMSLKPCHTQGIKPTRQEIQDEKAHLHDSVGDIAHSHRQGALWGDLFKNIHFEVGKTKTVAGYLNGKKVPNVLSHTIDSYDSLIIFIGTSKNEETLLKNAVKKDHIINVEQISTDCGT